MLLTDTRPPAVAAGVARRRLALDAALIALAVAAVVVVLAFPTSHARPLLVFLAGILVPGGAVLRHLRVRDPIAALGLAIALSLCIETAGSLVMVWTHWFHPEEFGLVLMIVAVAVIAADAVHTLRSPTFDDLDAETPIRSALRGADIARDLALLGPLVLALLLWATSLPSIDLYHLDDYGLTKELPLTWYAGFAMAILGAAATIMLPDTPRGWVVAAYVGGVSLIIFGTLPFVAEQPHFSWVYKHIGVTRLISDTGRVDPAIDIYNRWPGMFALSAAFGLAADRPNPVNYAAWAELFFSLTNMLLIAATVRAVTASVRVAAGACLLFVVSNWVGQGYYAPQALGFLLSLTVVYVAVRHLSTHGVGRGGEFIIRVAGRITRREQTAPAQEPPSPWPIRSTLAVLMLLDIVIVCSHQLTPYIIIMQLAVLALFGALRPRWIPLTVVGVTVAYLLPNLNYVDNNFGFFTSFDPLNNARHSSLYDIAPLQGKVFNAQAGQRLGMLMWLAGLIGAIALARSGRARQALPFALLAAAPFLVIFGQNYGGEAALRIILFTAPWASALTAWAISLIQRRVVRTVTLGLLATVMGGAFVPAYFGAEELNTIPKGQLEASQYFYDHARRGSVLLLSAPNFPVRYGETYRYFAGPQSDFDPNLLRLNKFRYRQLGERDVDDLVSLIHQYASTGYMVFSTSQERYADIFQLTPPGALRNLEKAIVASGVFKPWFRNADTRIYVLDQSATSFPTPRLGPSR